MKHLSVIALAAAGLVLAVPAQAVDLGIVAFQMSSDTHARVANAAEAAATNASPASVIAAAPPAAATGVGCEPSEILAPPG